MLSNNADEFVSGFRLRVIAVLGSDECAPRTARSTSSGALLLGAVVPEPVVVLVSLPCRSWSALKMEDMQSGLRFDGKPRGRRRTPPSHDWIFVPRPCRRASHTGSQAFAHAADEVPETRAINHACRIRLRSPSAYVLSRRAVSADSPLGPLLPQNGECRCPRRHGEAQRVRPLCSFSRTSMWSMACRECKSAGN